MNKIAIGISLAALAVCGVAVAEEAVRPAMGHAGPGPVTRAQAQQHAAMAFERMDANKDGKIDSSDREARRTARRTAMFERLDANHDGQVSREEFVNLKMERPMRGGPGGMEGHGMHGGPGMGGPGMGGHHGMRHHGMGGMRGMGHRMMQNADANKDGAVSNAEFTTAFLQRFDNMDSDHNGTVTPEERRAAHQAMMQQMHQNMQQKGSAPSAPPPPATHH